MSCTSEPLASHVKHHHALSARHIYIYIVYHEDRQAGRRDRATPCLLRMTKMTDTIHRDVYVCILSYIHNLPSLGQKIEKIRLLMKQFIPPEVMYYSYTPSRRSQRTHPKKAFFCTHHWPHKNEANNKASILEDDCLHTLCHDKTQKNASTWMADMKVM